MDKILDEKVRAYKAQLSAAGIECVREKPINYGWNLVCRLGSEEGRVNIYHGKKGISVVLQAKEGALKQALAGLDQAQPAGLSAAGFFGSQGEAPAIRPAAADTWMGCDESGKGDVFGPLVAAACQITKEEEVLFQKAGVCDSKALTDTKIATLAEYIRQTLADRCVVTVLMPEEYNKQYELLKKNKKNLNHLLGSLHGQNILCLLRKHKCPCIIVDKFGEDEYVLNELQTVAKTHRIIQIPKGERDTAVAAASILARDAFVRAMNTLSKRYGMTFPKGAYAGIAAAIAQFRHQYGDAELAFVGKLNFKTFDFLR